MRTVTAGFLGTTTIYTYGVFEFTTVPNRVTNVKVRIVRTFAVGQIIPQTNHASHLRLILPCLVVPCYLVPGALDRQYIRSMMQGELGFISPCRIRR